ncbi:hypothetical protein [Spirosoma rhododendri]|nr:hypothetical protein [Spirosoma rhododendri]
MITLTPIEPNPLLATVPLPLVGPAQQAYLLKGLKGPLTPSGPTGPI